MMMDMRVYSQTSGISNQESSPFSGIPMLDTTTLNITETQAIILVLTLLIALLIFLGFAIARVTDVKDQDPNSRSEAFVNAFPLLIQGTTIFLIVISSVLLALIDPGTGQSVVNLLAAIAGYVLGRATREEEVKKSKKQKPETPPTETTDI